MHPVYCVIFTVAAVLAVLLVGTMDYQDALDASDRYTQMVCEGHWPDYDQRNPACESFTQSKENDR